MIPSPSHNSFKMFTDLAAQGCPIQYGIHYLIKVPTHNNRKSRLIHVPYFLQRRSSLGHWHKAHESLFVPGFQPRQKVNVWSVTQPDLSKAHTPQYFTCCFSVSVFAVRLGKRPSELALKGLLMFLWEQLDNVWSLADLVETCTVNTDFFSLEKTDVTVPPVCLTIFPNCT